MRKRPKRWLPTAISCALILVICAVAGFRYIRERYSPSKERVDLNEMYQVTAADEAAILVNNLLTEEKAKIREGEAYLSYSYVTSMLNKRIYIDERERLLLYVLPDRIEQAAEGTRLSDMAGWNDVAGNNAPVWYEENAVLYVSVSCIRQFTAVDFQLYEQPGRLYVDTSWGIRQQSAVLEDTQLRRLGGIKSEIVADVAAGSQVVILDRMEEWSEVRTAEGFIGYIQNKNLEEPAVSETSSDFTEPEYTNLSRDYEICLVWHQVFEQTSGEALEEALSAAQGVNVIAPTWFSLSDDMGNFTSLADTGYVETAHARGLEVWALIDNFNTEVSTYEVLSRTSTRTTLIRNLMEAVRQYGLDGINIDFEGIKEDVGIHFVQFIRELSTACRQSGTVLSVDNYVPSAGTAYYDRAEQGVMADYLIIMGYDEHWRTSDAGSTASLPFVVSGIENTLLEAPQDRVINALPFYTRVWEFDPAAEVAEGADPLSAEYVLSSTAVGMGKARRLLEDGEAELVWNEEIGQYYGEYEQEGSLYRIWLEDIRSLQAKLNATASYDLAGIAFWKLGLESEDAWEAVAGYMNR